MYARELRKWSLKYQMSFLWLSAMVTLLLLTVYCPNATSMHLPMNTNSGDTALRITPAASGSSNWWFDRPNASNSNRIKSKQTKSDSSSSYISSSSISNTNTKYYDSYNPLAVFSGLRNHNARAKTPVNANAAAATAGTAADIADVADSINHNNHNINSNSNININIDNNNHNNNDNNYYVPNVPNSNSQINFNFRSYANSLTKSAYDNSNSRSNKLRRHANQSNANYHSPVRVAAATFHHQPAEMVSAPLPLTSPSPSPSSLSSSPPIPIPIKFIDSAELRQLLQQQSHNRTMLLAAAAARSRRDSATYGYLRNTSSSAAGSYQQHSSKHHQNHNSRNNNNNNNNNNRRNNNNINNNHRKRQRRYCSARDPAQLAFEAPTVVESKIISMEADRLANFAVSFAVQKVFKRQIEFSLKRNDYMRLQFTQRNTSAVCDIYKEKLVPRGLVRSEELEQGRIYILFVQQMDQSNFQILGQPIRRTQRVTESVMKAVREDYAQLASIRSITASNRTGELGRELQIVCKVQGQPPPKVTWFKDHKSINHNRRLYQFNHYKKKSELIIKSFNVSDAGIYECRAKNKVNKKVEKKNIVIKAKKPRSDVSTQQSGEKCPEDVSEFCFNGGTCKFFMEIHSYSCICTEGFIGERCDRKEMPPIPTYKTGYIADDPNVDDATDIESDENDEDDDDDDFIYPPTRDSTHNKFT